MTDIIKRIDAHLESDDAEQRWLNADNLLEEAQTEIEMLREQIERLREGMQYRINERDKFWRERDEAETKNVALREEIRRLRVEAGYD